MVTGLRVANFKAFGVVQRVPLRPLTLLFGPNSAGKSSLIHALLLAHESARTGSLDTHRTLLGGESVDLGGFRQYVHRRDAGRCVEWGIEIDVGSVSGRLRELLSPARRLEVAVVLGLNTEGLPRLLRYALASDGEPLLTAEIAGEALALKRLDTAHPAMRTVLEAMLLSATTAEGVDPDDLNAAGEAVSALRAELALAPGAFVPNGLAGRRVGPEAALFPVGGGHRGEDIAAAVRFWLPDVLHDLVAGVHETVAGFLNSLRYLGPLRSYPPRHPAFTPDPDANWHAGGGFAWDELRRRPELLDKVNAWLGASDRLQTPYRLAVRHMVAPERAGLEALIAAELVRGTEPAAFAQAVAEHLRQHCEEGFADLVLEDRNTGTEVSHRDVGIGVSQVLPVLAAAYGPSGRLWAIEQPEIHLHPALQADLGDVFVESALGPSRNRFILETHSEHLVLRLLRRIRERYEGDASPDAPPLAPEHVQVLYAQPSETGARLHAIPIAEDGDFAEPWPDGFFPEREEELF